jgi:GrpB-like predicted nucleotidyltransferase (UPF0157 family)/predicted enzyme related to lactoylglutathione lyase
MRPRELRVVITVPDHDDAVRLYRDVLGLSEEASFTDPNGGRATILGSGRATLEVGDEAHAEAVDALEVGHRVVTPVRLAFDVVDAADANGRLLDAGAKPLAPPTPTPWGSLNARVSGPGEQQITVYTNDSAARTPHGTTIRLIGPDPTWSSTAQRLIRDIRSSLGSAAIALAHVGSTSIPIPAKPVIDLVLGVPDSADETAYVAALESLGYTVRAREPEWHEHRLLRHDEPSTNLHVFTAGSPEIDRMLAFRDQLRRDPADRALYLATKRDLAAREWAVVQDYADAKREVVESILERAFALPVPPPRGHLVVVSGPGAARVRLARELARRLSLPLLSATTVADVLGAGRLDLVLTLADESGGAVLEGDFQAGQLDGRPLLEVSLGRPLGGGWRHVPASPDLDRLTRQLRQALAGDAGK